MAFTLQELGIKDLEHVTIKARRPLIMGERKIEKYEPILYFENLQIAQLTESSRVVAARGGYNNEPRVIWEDREHTTFQFIGGTLNIISFNLLLGAKMLLQNNSTPIPYVEKIELDDNGAAALKYIPVNNKEFYYIYEAGNIQERVYPTRTDKAVTLAGAPNRTLLCDYYFIYPKESLTYTMARQRLSDTYSLEATFYLKDENDGILRTGLIEMPAIFIQSNINLRLGERADPMVSTFNIVAMPERIENQDVICKITYFDEDLSGI